MRIVGGDWKRSKLRVLDRPGLRPTPDRVRETLFNWLGQDLSGWRCLDAYAGSGALGFEAASRGAAEVVLLERDRVLVQALDEARERLKAATLRIEAADAVSWMSRCAPGTLRAGAARPAVRRRPRRAVARRRRAAAGAGRVCLCRRAGRRCPTRRSRRSASNRTAAGRAGAVHFQLARKLPATDSAPLPP